MSERVSERDALRERALSLVERLADGGRDDAARDALLDDLAAYQARTVVPYGRIVASRGAGAALPTDVFRFARVASHEAADDVRVFKTSGTTNGERGVHAFADLSVYDAAAKAAARHMLFPDVDRMPLLVLAPTEEEAPHSSLSYMLARFAEWFGEGPTRWLLRDSALDIDALEEAIRGAGGPIALLGTSFAFVHANDALGGRRFRLPEGSRVMQTGGFKGLSREVAPEAMRAMLSRTYELPEEMIVAEYGMTELSSQLYETTLRDAVLPRDGEPGPRRLWWPGWMRATVVDPETLRPVEAKVEQGGAVGILRLDDVANLDSVASIQTSDLAQRRGDGVVLLGRAPGAVPRGCSLAVDEALGGSAREP